MSQLFDKNYNEITHLSNVMIDGEKFTCIDTPIQWEFWGDETKVIVYKNSKPTTKDDFELVHKRTDDTPSFFEILEQQ